MKFIKTTDGDYINFERVDRLSISCEQSEVIKQLQERNPDNDVLNKFFNCKIVAHYANGRMYWIETFSNLAEAEKRLAELVAELNGVI